ncbi:hypothetical protein GW17_00059702, partial [Ensete ventricosum]
MRIARYQAGGKKKARSVEEKEEEREAKKREMKRENQETLRHIQIRRRLPSTIPIKEVMARRRLEQRKWQCPSSSRLQFYSFFFTAFFTKDQRRLQPSTSSSNATNKEMKETTFFPRLRRQEEEETKFSIPICTARTRWYVLVCQVTGTRTARYRAVPPKSTVDGRLKEKSIVDGRLKEKSIIDDRLRKKKGRRGKEERRRRGEEIPRAVLARTSSPPAGHFSPVRGERSRR